MINPIRNINSKEFSNQLKQKKPMLNSTFQEPLKNLIVILVVPVENKKSKDLKKN